MKAGYRMMRAQYSGDVLNNRVANELKKRGFMISPAGVRRCHAAGAQRAGRAVSLRVSAHFGISLRTVAC